VYNNLSSLVEEGALRVIRVDRTMRFDPLIEPHSHALCDSCGSLFDVASPTPPRTRLPRGFRCRAVTVDYLGLCRSCVRKGRGAP
jgi:Fe2+ or Zn2+ uptake regulation protein